LRGSNSLSCCTIRCGSGTQPTCATAGGAGRRAVVVSRPALLGLDPSSASAAKAQLVPCNGVTYVCGKLVNYLLIFVNKRHICPVEE
jgi:hypothetical protein